MRFTLRKKLSFGFGVMILLIVTVAVIVSLRVETLNADQTRLVELRQPTAISGFAVLNGVNQSLAGFTWLYDTRN